MQSPELSRMLRLDLASLEVRGGRRGLVLGGEARRHFLHEREAPMLELALHRDDDDAQCDRDEKADDREGRGGAPGEPGLIRALDEQRILCHAHLCGHAPEVFHDALARIGREAGDRAGRVAGLAQLELSGHFVQPVFGKLCEPAAASLLLGVVRNELSQVTQQCMNVARNALVGL